VTTANTYRAGIIGCGRSGNVHAGAYKKIENVELVACANRGAARLQDFANQWEIPGRYTDLVEMLQQESLDLVSICTKDDQHVEPVLRTAEFRPKGIFCEKPLAFTLDEVDLILEACRAGGIKLSVSHSMRFERHYVHAKELATSGELGALQEVHFIGYGMSGDLHALLHEDHCIDFLRFCAGEPAWVFCYPDSTPDRPGLSGTLHFQNGVVDQMTIGGRREFATYQVIFECSRGRVDAVIGPDPAGSLNTLGAGCWEPFLRVWRGTPGGLAGYRDGDLLKTLRNDPWELGLRELIHCIEEDKESVVQRGGRPKNATTHFGCCGVGTATKQN
jgi:predicted dehydrogenase